MRGMKDKMAHDYFYEGVDKGAYKKYAGQALSYNRDCAVSYSTTIAITIPRKGYKKADPHKQMSGLCLVTFDSMSSCTAQHRAAVIAASPFDVIHVPFTYGKTYYGADEMRKRFLEELERYAKDITHSESRRKFVDLMTSRSEILAKACEAWAKPLRSKKAFGKFEAIFEGLEAYTAKLKAQRRADSAKKEARKRKFLKQYEGKTGKSYNDLIQSIYDTLDRNPLNLSVQERHEARDILGYGSYFCWLSGDTVRTNRSIEIPVQEVRIALKAWAAGKDMRCAQVGNYSVVSYQGDTIQIGCHRFTRRNLLALYEVVVGKPFPTETDKEVK